MTLKSFVAALALSAIASSAFAQETPQTPPAGPQQPSTTIVKPGKEIDPVWNGVLIGAGVGAVGAWIFTRANCGPAGYDDECTVYAAAAGTAIFVPGGMLVGGIIDRLINKTLPAGATSRTSIAPLMSTKGARKNAGVALKIKIQF